MKFSYIVAFVLPLAVSANPVAAPEAAPEAVPDASPNPLAEVSNTLEARADKWCNLGTSTAQGCDYDRWGSSRKRTVNVNERFGVRCWSNGQNVNGNYKWDYIPGWDCWISARWTNTNCESGVPNPCPAIYD
ncbi:hypothetical protein PVAG01_07653 [Phlyctema vagabunda]|uniref:Uncharacterized protein n=1 Tax=Phlyctema vagabunda TaxID=108571 RepID=A0ABR4PD28_9HELO